MLGRSPSRNLYALSVKQTAHERRSLTPTIKMLWGEGIALGACTRSWVQQPVSPLKKEKKLWQIQELKHESAESICPALYPVFSPLLCIMNSCPLMSSQALKGLSVPSVTASWWTQNLRLFTQWRNSTVLFFCFFKMKFMIWNRGWCYPRLGVELYLHSSRQESFSRKTKLKFNFWKADIHSKPHRSFWSQKWLRTH